MVGLPNPRLSDLEAKLGHEVFLRRGRALVATPFGLALTARARAAVDALVVADHTAVEGAMAADRRIVVATSPLFAERVLPRALARLAELRPHVRVEVRTSHDYADLHGEHVDVALRRGPLADSTSLRARRLGRTTMICVALPALSPSGASPVEERCRALPWIRVGPRLEPFVLGVAGRRGMKEVSLVPRFAVDDQRVALDLALHGLGATRVNLFLAREHLESGDLVEVVPEARSVEDVFAVWPARTSTTPLARELVARVSEAATAARIWD
jgi:DNA-binding transcriptional LysR family regulator